jgi:hypothetical protein
LAEFTYMNPKPMTSSTIAIFTTTITLLNRADSLMPTTSSAVMRSTRMMAGRLITPPGTASSDLVASVHR